MKRKQKENRQSQTKLLVLSRAKKIFFGTGVHGEAFRFGYLLQLECNNSVPWDRKEKGTEALN